MSANRETTRSLAYASCRLGDKIDEWIQKFPGEAIQKSLTRTTFMHSRVDLSRIESALSWGPSVGLYGESQCGKSMLVSRFASGLGAGCSQDGSLLIADSTPKSTRESEATRPRWYQDEIEAAQAGIDFASWIDPKAGRDSTGIVCRFTRTRPVGLKDGHFLIQLMSVSELVSSIVLGFNAESEERESKGRKERMIRVLKDLECEPREKDREGLMSQLLYAWEFLSRDHVLGRTLHFLTVDNGDQGWDEFVRMCVDEGTRPVFVDGPQESSFDRLVALLWDSVPAVSRLWRRLFKELYKLGMADDVMVPISDVCTDRPRDGKRPSLVAVEWMTRIWSEESDVTCGVEPRGSKGGSRRVSSAALVSLARTIILPVGDELAEGEWGLDVLDYPGARAETKSLDFTDEERAPKHAVDALLRGKINRLFVSSVDHFDSSILCLAVGGTGNLEAPSPVCRAIHNWLQREDWWGCRDEVEEGVLDFEADRLAKAPPMVVAMTKSDMVFANGAPAFEAKVRDLREKYSSEFNWMDDWEGHQPFREIYWVHNPTVDGAIQLAEKPVQEQNQRILECLEQRLLEKHTAMPELRLRSMFETPPGDVDLLFEAIRSKADSDRREADLARFLISALQEMLTPVNAVYIGPGDGARTEAERQLAETHVALLRKALKRSSAVADFLHVLSVPADFVAKAYEKAVRDLAADEEIGGEAIDFDDIYSSICAAYVGRFEKEMARTVGWASRLEESSQSLKVELAARFKRIPNCQWFHDSIKKAVQPFVQYDAANTNVEALASIFSAIWNRNMVWLGKIPEAPLEPSRLPPTLRGKRAASEAILEHWEEQLPACYAMLVDPASRATGSNIGLREIRQDFLPAVNEFLKTFDDQSANMSLWGGMIETLEGIRDDLSESEEA